MPLLLPSGAAASTTETAAGLVAEGTDALEGDQQANSIIVTGQRFSRTLQETNSSVDVTTSQEIKAQAAPDRIDQLLQFVPNVTLGAGDQGPSIRGQESTGVLQGADAFLGGSRPRTTIQVDGRPLSYNEFIYGIAPVWDVDRVEVYRTPQTTTQGRNSIAGAIFIETADPTYAPEARGRLIAGNYDTWQASAALSVPLVTDELAVRVAGDLRRSRSWSQVPDVIEGIDSQDDNFGLLRAKLLVEPKALPGSRFELSYVHLESQAPQGETVRFPFRDRVNDQGGGGIWATNVDSLTGRFDFDLGGEFGLQITPSWGNVVVDRFAAAGDGVALVEANDLSLETVLRFGGEANGMSGVAGIYAFRSDQTEFIDLSSFIGIGNFTDEQDSLGLFGDVSWRPAPRIELSGGLRYQRDHQDRDGFLGTDEFGFSVDYGRSFDAWLPKVSIAFEPSDALRVGALAQRAYNPGGTTISFTTGLQDVFEEETLWTYELFARAQALGGRLTLNGNLFYTDFNNAQRPLTSVVTRPDGFEELETQIANAPSAHSYGVEAELGFAVTPRLELRAAVGLLHTEIGEEGLDAADPIAGREFQRAPNFTGVVAVDWRPLDPLRLSAQLRHNGGYFSDDANTPALAIDQATTVDARAAYEIGPATAFVYARNLFDDFALTQLYASDFGTANDPREIGAGIEVRF